MPSVRRFLLISALVGVALIVSGFLYVRSQAADFNRHARAIEAIGTVRHLDELLSEQVLAARFGLLNQYDPITSTELALADAAGVLEIRIGALFPGDGELTEDERRLDDSITRQRLRVERFKAENSVLKNSLYYLPNATRELELRLAASEGAAGQAKGETALSIRRLVQAALVYNLIGDQTSGAALRQAISRLQANKPSASDGTREAVDLLLAHANVIAEKLPTLDRWVKEVVDNDIDQRLAETEHAYQDRFGRAVETSNRYRKVLYGWSMALVLAVGVAGVMLRRIYADLERRVAERTAEVQKALSALWGEMKLARKIQEALVPSSPALANCDVAARMQATDEVGGDYYDVVHAEGAEWILIGDVSGHGISAGLVMMMCHTAVRSVLRSRPSVRPDELLSLVNTVLTESIRQLGEDRYMTITAFRREANGNVSFAGAHQDIQIFRANTRTIETLASSGVWLGLKDNIDDLLTTRQFRLAAGDVLVLYTDGIVEATRGTSTFDTSGLQEVLCKAAGKTAEHVLGDLFTAVERFDLKDDATMLVLRQLDANVPIHTIGSGPMPAGARSQPATTVVTQSSSSLK
jgi:serine phosphatase RsbU (regulator of sigma subunit)